MAAGSPGGAPGGSGWGRLGLPPVVQRPPVDARPRETPSYALLVLVGRPVWAWRTELGIAAALLFAWAQLAEVLPSLLALVVLAATVAGLLHVPRLRARLAWVLRRAQVLRRWEAAARYAGLATAKDRIPKVCRIGATAAGELLRVRVPDGACVRRLEDAADVLAAMLEARDVHVTRDRDNARYASVTLVRRDPLAQGSAPWPLLDVPRLSLWEPVPVGVDETGRQVTVTLPERNVLLGGEPGAGKSVAQSLLVAAAALDPEVELFLLDGKQVELAPWAKCAARSVGPNVAEATALLEELRAEMDARYAVLLGEGRRKVSRGDGLRLRLVVVDELAFLGSRRHGPGAVRWAATQAGVRQDPAGGPREADGAAAAGAVGASGADSGADGRGVSGVVAAGGRGAEASSSHG